MNNSISLDHNATTPVLEDVLSAMLPYFTQHFGNASSKTHAYGWIAEQAVETAQIQVAQLINANKEEIIFTSGATESINTAIKGIAAVYGTHKNHIITAATEHLAVLDTIENLSKKAEDKNQFAAAINAEFRAGQMAGHFVDNKVITHLGLEGMSREQLERRLEELENKIETSRNIIDVTSEAVIEKS